MSVLTSHKTGAQAPPAQCPQSKNSPLEVRARECSFPNGPSPRSIEPSPTNARVTRYAQGGIRSLPVQIQPTKHPTTNSSTLLALKKGVSLFWLLVTRRQSRGKQRDTDSRRPSPGGRREQVSVEAPPFAVCGASHRRPPIACSLQCPEQSHPQRQKIRGCLGSGEKGGNGTTTKGYGVFEREMEMFSK